MAEKLAKQGWFVRVETVGVAFHPAVMDFAVGKNDSREAMAAVLDHPAIEPGDKVTSTDRLTATEIWSLRLRPDEVRTYGKRPQSPRG
jgi:hypothetical protein